MKEENRIEQESGDEKREQRRTEQNRGEENRTEVK